MSNHHPIPDSESEAFWTSIADGKLMLRRCTECRRFHYYPRTNCPYCWGETEWVQASGEGVIFASTTVRRMGLPPFNKRVPYNLSIVELAEGPRMLTNVVGCPVQDAVIDAKVTFSPSQDEDRWMPTFRLAGRP